MWKLLHTTSGVHFTEYMLLQAGQESLKKDVMADNSNLDRETTQHCASVWCNSVQSKENKDKIKFHNFPMDRMLCKLWITTCGRHDLLKAPYNLYKSHHLCSKHFTDEQYQNPSRLHLHEFAVPSLFLKIKAVRPKTGTDKNKESDVQKEKQVVKERIPDPTSVMGEIKVEPEYFDEENFGETKKDSIASEDQVFVDVGIVKKENKTEFTEENDTERDLSEENCAEFGVKEEIEDELNDEEEARCGSIEDASSSSKKRENYLAHSACHYSTTRNENLKQHCLIHSAKKVLGCSKCVYTTRRKSLLNRHQLTHSGTKRFETNLRNFASKKDGLKRCECIRKGKSFECVKCFYSTKCERSLDEHWLSHSQHEAFQCSKCDFSTNVADLFDCHAFTHSEVKPIKCDLCEFTVSSKGSLHKHMLTHAQTKMFKCSKCDYATNFKGDLKVHDEMNHTKCSYSTNSIISLKDHALTQCKTNNINHTHGFYTMDLENLLRQHKFKYWGEKTNTRCSDCEFFTTDKDVMKEHQSMHLTGRELMSNVIVHTATAIQDRTVI